MTPAALPVSMLAPARRFPSPAWLIPLAALVLAGVLGYQALAQRGPMITITFSHSAGIQPNDPVTYRAVEVGRVKGVALSPDLQQVLVWVQLRPDAAGLATEGSTFWVVRPEVSLTRVTGLETLLGPRYIAAEPPPPGAEGDAPPRRHARSFVGLERPPRIGPHSPPGLDITLRAQRLASVSEGAPVTFREMRVGSVTSVALTPDARWIEVQLRVEPQFAHLVRSNTKFWNVSGIGVDLGLLGGVKLKAESLETILSGGIAFATPTRAGPPVQSGHSFDMEASPVDDWTKWTPDLSPPALTSGN